MIKEILSIVNLPHVLNFIKPFLTHNHLEYIKTSINKFMLCRDTKAGFIKYTCTECGHYHTIPITCKSRLCPSCGFKYSATLKFIVYISINFYIFFLKSFHFKIFIHFK